MCNEVCYCCEKDICNCTLQPEIPLNDIIVKAINTSIEIVYKKFKFTRVSGERTKFYMFTETKNFNGELVQNEHIKMCEKIKDLGHRMTHDPDVYYGGYYSIFEFYNKPIIQQEPATIPEFMRCDSDEDYYDDDPEVE